MSVEPVCVTKAKVELRKGPGNKHAISWLVGKNMPFLKVGEVKDKQKKRWYEVRDVDGEKHWVQASLVSRKISCAVVRSKQARLRQGPGKNFPSAELELVDRYTPFKKVDRDGEWVQLQDDYQEKYWVHETNLWIPAARSSVTF